MQPFMNVKRDELFFRELLGCRKKPGRSIGLRDCASEDGAVEVGMKSSLIRVKIGLNIPLGHIKVGALNFGNQYSQSGNALYIELFEVLDGS